MTKASRKFGQHLIGFSLFRDSGLTSVSGFVKKFTSHVFNDHYRMYDLIEEGGISTAYFEAPSTETTAHKDVWRVTLDSRGDWNSLQLEHVATGVVEEYEELEEDDIDCAHSVHSLESFYALQRTLLWALLNK